MKPKHMWIDSKVFSKILENVPVACADTILITKDSEIALVKRNENNATHPGSWGTPGGRIFRNETIKSAAKRIVKREVNINVPISGLKQIGVVEIFAGKEHGITNLMFAIVKKQELKVDSTSSDAQWFPINKLPPLRAHFREMIRKTKEFRNGK